MENNKELIEAIHRLELHVTNKLATHTEKLGEHCDKLDTLFEKLARTERTIYGIGGGEDGLATRIKLLEGSNRATVWGLSSISVPTFFKAVYDFFTNGH